MPITPFPPCLSDSKDRHLPCLTVRQTVQFALGCKSKADGDDHVNHTVTKHQAPMVPIAANDFFTMTLKITSRHCSNPSVNFVKKALTNSRQWSPMGLRPHQETTPPAAACWP